MSTLKVNKLRDTAGSADAITLDPNGGAVLAGVTTVTSVKVGAAVTISESGIEATGVGITVANINGTQIGGKRNLIINGAMHIAQRGTSSTSTGYGSVDRFAISASGQDEAPTAAQVDVSSGTTPYTLGFRKSYKITNGNQTSGAGAGDLYRIYQFIEAQNIATSGWNYTSTSSDITVSCWVKSSVAQNFYIEFRTQDGTQKAYVWETGSLTADTWTKVIKTIPGDSGISFNNDTGHGACIFFHLFNGTDTTTSSHTLNQWAAYNTSSRTPDFTSTWYTTNDATFELTGVQIEIGSQATPFEHLNFTEELNLCQRYYQVGSSIGCGYGSADGYARGGYIYATQMRSTPTLTLTNSGSGSIVASDTSNTGFYVTYGSLGGSSAGIFSYTAASEL